MLEHILGTALIPLSALVQTALSKEAASFCPVPDSEYYDRENDETIQEFFECPGPDDPPENTLCCDKECCPLVHVDALTGLDIRIVAAVSITVIILCLIAGIGIVVCCFWSPCPMYDTCGGSYKRTGGNLPFGDLDGRDTDPLTSGVNQYYAPPSIKVKVDKAAHV